MSKPIDGDKLIARLKMNRLRILLELDSDGAAVFDEIVDWIQLEPTLSPPNEPLTIEQLREMDGEPVWLDVADGVWALIDTDDDCVWLDRGGSIDIFRLTGKAYRRPSEGEA